MNIEAALNQLGKTSRSPKQAVNQDAPVAPAVHHYPTENYDYGKRVRKSKSFHYKPGEVTVELLAGELMPGETTQEIIACNDYLRMGPTRTMRVLLDGYQADPANAPVSSRATMWSWSSVFRWVHRADLYDAAIDGYKTIYAKEVMETGLALAFNRVTRLKALAERLEEDLDAHLYLDDVKQIGMGRYAEKVKLIAFNSRLVEHYRGVLDDLAKETGGRVRRSELSGPDGGAIGIDIDVDQIRAKLAERFAEIAGEPNNSAESDPA